ncbi:hypothetical protein CEXT_407681 [Caerostris extrusa]|uniref:Uncharacterized protein n=1 Tax=Caerostris extrusa TaxID=172846 RepID=A0AAV4MRX9_CAEEX|nr:hypothetical protein CEXT_407681 [Caerostris extrusa]
MLDTTITSLYLELRFVKEEEGEFVYPHSDGSKRRRFHKSGRILLEGFRALLTCGSASVLYSFCISLLGLRFSITIALLPPQLNQMVTQVYKLLVDVDSTYTTDSMELAAGVKNVVFLDGCRHRPVEQDHRAARHAVPGVHEAAAAHGAQLRGEPAQVHGLRLREALPGRALPGRQLRAQQAQSESGARPPVQDAGHRPREEDLRGQRPTPSIYQRVVRRGQKSMPTSIVIRIEYSNTNSGRKWSHELVSFRVGIRFRLAFRISEEIPAVGAGTYKLCMNLSESKICLDIALNRFG